MTQTPKQKAKELLYRIMPLSNPLNDGNYKDNMNRSIHAKEICHIICDEIIEEEREYCDNNYHQDRMLFWQEVKQEIERI